MNSEDEVKKSLKKESQGLERSADVDPRMHHSALSLTSELSRQREAKEHVGEEEAAEEESIKQEGGVVLHEQQIHSQTDVRVSEEEGQELGEAHLGQNA